MARKKKRETKWVGMKPDLEKHFGFCYLITNLTNNMKYIGKKQLFVKSGKVKTAPTNRLSSKWKDHHWKESDWKFYKSSSDHVKKDIKKLGESSFRFEIISLHSSKSELHYAEIDWQVQTNCLRKKLDNGEREYYNRQIAGVKFIPPDYHCEETRRKFSKINSGLNHNLADQEVYDMINLETLEEKSLTRYEIINNKLLSKSSFVKLKKGLVGQTNGWTFKEKYLSGEETNIKKSSRGSDRGLKLRSYYHIPTGVFEECTQGDLKKKYNLPKSCFRKDPKTGLQRYKGWIEFPEEYDEGYLKSLDHPVGKPRHGNSKELLKEC